MSETAVKDREYVTIEEARTHIAPYSAGWYYSRINDGLIEAAGGGRGAVLMIATASLRSHLKSIKNKKDPVSE